MRRFVLGTCMVGLVASAAVGVGLGCDAFVNRVSVGDCAGSMPEAVINVAGVFRYSGDGSNAGTGNGFSFSGTITFEQDGNRVRVSDTTYDVGVLRPVAGDFAELDGNVLDTVLTPINGDEDYVAAVRFIFSDDGNEFCVQFTDTNDDSGGLGSFVGSRQQL